ncbi:MAG TPA: Fe-S cluster assembly protein IscX [Polyangia bacterium]|jgi:FeS assembly protein IscX
MGIQWSDVGSIAIELVAEHPELDPLEVPFSRLAAYVMDLAEFEGEIMRPDDQVLAAIQQAWINEVEGLAGAFEDPPEPDDPAVSYPVT